MTNKFKLGDIIRAWYNYKIMQVVEEGEGYIRLQQVSTGEIQTVDITSDIYDELRKVEITEELMEQYPELRKDRYEELVNTTRYATTSGKQLFDVLEDDLLTYEELRGFYKANIYKYTHRYKEKNGIEDLKKVKVYVNQLIKLEESNETK